jgi:peptidoglycan/LPS O-acetylase OafA/YrhL
MTAGVRHNLQRPRAAEVDVPAAPGPPPAGPKVKNRQDNIDLLRAIAILAVVAYHYTTRFPPAFYHAARMPFTFPLGHFGVDLFFTVSGFCIFMTLDSSRTLENFWARRIARIQPAYVVAICITFAVVSVAGLPGRSVSAAIALSNMVWLNSIPQWPAVDSAYWSLVVELKFYLWIGIIYYLMRGRNISLAWLCFSLAGVGLALCGGALHNIGTQFLIGPFAPSFLAGLLAWEWPRLKRPYALGVGVGTCLLLLISPRFAELAGIGVLVSGAGFLILRMRWLRIPRPITFIGLVSYSLYLLHQNLGYVIIRSLPGDVSLRILAAFLVVLASAALLYWAVERRWEQLVRQRAEHLIELGRRSLRLPHRRIAHPTITESVRTW